MKTLLIVLLSSAILPAGVISHLAVGGLGYYIGKNNGSKEVIIEKPITATIDSSFDVLSLQMYTEPVEADKVYDMTTGMVITKSYYRAKGDFLQYWHKTKKSTMKAYLDELYPGQVVSYHVENDRYEIKITVLLKR